MKVTTQGVNMEATIDVYNCDNDSLHFRLGNPIVEYWENSIKIKHAKWAYDDKKMLLSIACPNNNFSFNIKYDYIAWTNVLNNNIATVYDNKEYEIALPICQDKAKIKIEDYNLMSINRNVSFMVQTYNDNIPAIICYQADSLSSFLDFSEHFTLSLSTQKDIAEKDLNRLSNKLSSFYRLVSDRLWEVYPKINIWEFNYIGNTVFGNNLIISPTDFKTITLFHELMHCWISPNIFSSEQYGYYIITETINEFLMNYYYAKISGEFDSTWNNILMRKRNILKSHKEPISSSLASLSKYSKSSHHLIMDYGCIVFDLLGNKIGLDNLVSTIETFLLESKNEHLSYRNLKELLVKEYGEEICSDFISQMESCRLIIK